MLVGIGLFMTLEKLTHASSEFKLERDPSGLTYKIKRTDKTVRLNFMLVKDRETGELVYCLEPGVALSENTYNEWEEWDYAKVNLTEEQKDFITKVAYFGYGYQDHTNLYYFYAAQLLIWEKIIPKDWDIYYTEVLGGDRVNWFQEEREEILRLIKRDETMPSMQKKVIEWNQNGTLILTDENRVLEDYHLKTGTDWTVEQEGNQLKIQSTTATEQTLVFEKNYEGKPLKFYSREDGQNLIRKGKLMDKQFEITLKPYQIDLEIQKTDEEQNPLENVQFELYASSEIRDNNQNLLYLENEKIADLKTDRDGKASLKNLWDGNYCLIETQTNENYEILKEPICFELNKQKNHEVIPLTNQKKKQKLLIQKKDAETNVSLENVHFKIWNELGEVIFDGFTNEFGEILLEALPVGTYKMVEVETIEGYVLETSPIYFDLDGEEEEKIITMTNRKIEKVPETKEMKIPNFNPWLYKDPEERKKRK